MENSFDNIVEVTGYIKKQENLVPVGDNIMPNTCVLESLRPFPGYYGSNFPDQSQPRSIFILLREAHDFEEVARKTKNVKERFPHDFNASEGKILIAPYEYHCLRVKYLSSFNFLPELQKEYMEENIKFHKEKDIKTEAIIKINKVFRVYEKEQGVYRDVEDDYKCYLEIPMQLNWETFVSITADIKNNMVNYMFDAALGVLFRSKSIVDVIRIYDHEKDVEKMKKLRDMYLEEIRKMNKL
ncbi:MAG: hypothetical protein ACQESJ_04150 [Bacteroidota bacterium]